MFNTPHSVSWLPVISNTVLAVLKLATAFTIGSVSVFSDGLDTTVDVLSAFIAFVGVRVASWPPDESHPYGHGQAEYISGLVESVIIIGGGAFITFQAVQRLIHGAELGPVDLGIIVLTVSLVVNTGVSFQLYRVARRFDSVALKAAARHRASDMLTSAGVLAGLVVVRFTEMDFLDPLIALGVAGVVFWAGWGIAKQSARGLMNPSLDAEERRKIDSIIQTTSHVIEVKHLRTGRVGKYFRIEATVTMNADLSMTQSHEATEQIEGTLWDEFPDAWINIHVEPPG